MSTAYYIFYHNPNKHFYAFYRKSRYVSIRHINLSFLLIFLILSYHFHLILQLNLILHILKLSIAEKSEVASRLYKQHTIFILIVSVYISIVLPVEYKAKTFQPLILINLYFQLPFRREHRIISR